MLFVPYYCFVWKPVQWTNNVRAKNEAFKNVFVNERWEVDEKKRQILQKLQWKKTTERDQGKKKYSTYKNKNTVPMRRHSSLIKDVLEGNVKGKDNVTSEWTILRDGLPEACMNAHWGHCIVGIWDYNSWSSVQR